MKRKIKDKNKPVGKLIRANDFLPSPEKLIILEEAGFFKAQCTTCLNKEQIPPTRWIWD